MHLAPEHSTAPWVELRRSNAAEPGRRRHIAGRAHPQRLEEPMFEERVQPLVIDRFDNLRKQNGSQIRVGLSASRAGLEWRAIDQCEGRLATCYFTKEGAPGRQT